MFKVLVIVSFLTTLFVQFSTENAIPNSELDKKLSIMWNEVNNYMRNDTNALEDSDIEAGLHPLTKVQKTIDSNISRRLNEHFKKVEEQARLSGKLDNVLVESVFFKFLYEEIKNSDFIPLFKQEIKNLYEDKIVQEIMLQFIDKVIVIFHEGFKVLIHELEANPRNIFKERTSEEEFEDKNRFKHIKATNYNRLMKYKDETLEKLKKIGKESEFEKMMDFINLIK